MNNNEKKKILIYAHYYIPDVASTGQILSELAEGMTDQFDVTVICVVPSYSGVVSETYKGERFYREEINGVHVIRVAVPEFDKNNKKSRVKNIVAYYLNARRATALVGPVDYVYSISQPPLMGGMLGLYGKRKKKAKFIYNIQDFNPEQTIAVGFTKRKWITDTMLWVDKLNCRSSDLVITVGRDLVDTMRKRFYGYKVPRTLMINNWIDETLIHPLDPKDEDVLAFRKWYGLDDKFVIMYSGNLGLYYDLENILKSIQRVTEKAGGALEHQCDDGTVTQVVFAFVGDGSLKPRLEAYQQAAHLDNVLFIPYQEKNKIIYSLNAGDVHWCVNAKGIKGVSCPSKGYGIMGVGKPVLGVLEEGAEVRCLIEDSECGKCCAPGEYDRIEELIQWFAAQKDSDLHAMGLRGRTYLEENLTKDKSIKKYMDAILNL